jgi:hypothetical protein
MSRNICIITISLFLSVASFLWAQEFETGNKINIKVNVNVTGEIFRLIKYNYDVLSLPESQQNVNDFRVIFKFKPDSILERYKMSEWWGPYVLDNDTLSWIGWGASDNANIKPNNSLSGFGFLTRYLPGITDYYAEGDHPIPSFEYGMAPDFIPGYDDLTPYGPGIVGKTVGPVLTPDPFIALAFLDTLASYKHQALDLGWIDNQGIATSLDQKLENIKKQLEKGKTKQAINMLNAFLNEVEAQKDKHLTSEAYALLKYNAEYLIQRLEED